VRFDPDLNCLVNEQDAEDNEERAFQLMQSLKCACLHHLYEAKT